MHAVSGGGSRRTATIYERDARKLAALVDLTLEMAFLIEKVLETEVGLVHVVSGVSSDLFTSASCGVGIAVESFQTGEKCTRADVDGSRIIVWEGVDSELTKCVDDEVWGLHQVQDSVSPTVPETGTGQSRSEFDPSFHLSRLTTRLA